MNFRPPLLLHFTNITNNSCMDTSYSCSMCMDTSSCRYMDSSSHNTGNNILDTTNCSNSLDIRTCKYSLEIANHGQNVSYPSVEMQIEIFADSHYYRYRH
jgi:hypothetical protein